MKLTILKQVTIQPTHYMYTEKHHLSDLLRCKRYILWLCT